jgi:hypothetical protein
MPGVETQNILPVYVTTDSGNESSASMRLTESIEHTGEAAWTQVDAQCTVTADAAVYKIGAKSAKMAMAAGAAAGVQAWGQVVNNNTNMVTSGWDHIKFWIQASAALATGDFQIGLSDAAAGTGGEFVDIPAAPVLGVWYRMTLALSAAQKALTSVSSVQLKMIVDKTIDIYIDDVRLCKYDGSGDAIIPLEVSTFNNANADGIQSEMWLLPQAEKHVSVYYLPQNLTLTYYMGTPGAYSASDSIYGTSYLRIYQTVIDMARPCTALLLRPGADLVTSEAFEIEVS